MNRFILLLCLAAAYLASYAHFPSPLAQQAKVDSMMIFGNRDTYADHIKIFSELASKAKDKKEATNYEALVAEFHFFSGQLEESLRHYRRIIDSFTDDIPDDTKLSIICSAVQTAIDLGTIENLMPYLDYGKRTYARIDGSCDAGMSDYYLLTMLLVCQFTYDRSALEVSDRLSERFMAKYGPSSPQYAIMCRIAANIHAAFDMRSQASFNYSAALDIWEGKKPTVEKFTAYLGFGALACELSDFKSARLHLAEAERILDELGLQLTYYGLLLSEMKCTLYTLTNAWNDVLAVCEKAEKLSVELFGPNHITALRLAAGKGAALVFTGNPVEAMETLNVAVNDKEFISSRMGNDYLVALALWSSMFGVVLPDQVIQLNQVAEKQIFNQCPRKHSVTYNFYEAWGQAHLNKSDYKEAVSRYRNSFESSRRSMHTSLSFLTEKDRAQLIKDIYHYQDNVFWLGTAPSGEGNVAPLLFDNALFIKSLMMQSVSSLKRQVEMIPENETEAHSLLDSFLALKRKRLHGETVSEKEFNLAEQRILKYLENHPEYGDYLGFLYTDWTHVAEKLGDNDAVVEFIVNEGTHDHNRTFAAEVLTRGNKPRHVKLFIINHKDNHLLNTDKGEFNRFVRDSIWTAELRSYLPKGGNIYFVPTAELYGMALEYIPVGKERVPMADTYNMVRLSSSRELVLNFSDSPLPQEYTAAIFGGLNYNTSVDDMELYALETGERGHRGSTLWQMLPGTRTEAENVAQALNVHNTRLITGDEGVEESFKALDGAKTDIIHIATHGFYNTEETSDPDSALDRTGLIMSGANNFWITQTAPIGMDDGVLTAREIADLDLRDTDMVVLSACQTGLGDVTGEGVFGLQRAFKMAGAKSILMSLWEVNDEATQVFMTEFYRNLKARLTKRNALSAARKSMATRTFTVDGIPLPGSDPRFSAAFVLLD